MTRVRRLLRALGPALAALALLVVASAAAVSAPTDDDVQEPIEVRGGVGERLVGRTAVLTADAVHVARRLDLPGDAAVDTTTPGVCVAVDVTVSCRLASCSFGGSLLRAAGRSYAPAVLVPTPSFVQLLGAPGLRYRTTAVFEVPAAALRTGRAELVAQEGATFALDSVPVAVLRLPSRVEEEATVLVPTIVGADR